jgi:hypothetical protein
MLKKMLTLGAAALLLGGVSLAQAEILNQMVSNGNFASAYQGSTGFTVTTEGSGVNQKTTLMVNTYTYGVGFTSWKGEIPASAVVMDGVSQISVNIDTCSINNDPGCGYIDATVTKDPLDGGWIINGASSTTYGDLTQTIAGVRQTHRANAVGTINGITLGAFARSFIGKDNNVTITVSKP